MYFQNNIGDEARRGEVARKDYTTAKTVLPLTRVRKTPQMKTTSNNKVTKDKAAKGEVTLANRTDVEDKDKEEHGSQSIAK